jgi:hypothetical protein
MMCLCVCVRMMHVVVTDDDDCIMDCCMKLTSLGSLEGNLESLTLDAEHFRVPNFVYVDHNTSSNLLPVVKDPFICMSLDTVYF